MKAAVYNPYLETLGGGERYSMAFALVLAKQGFRVFVQSDTNQIKKKLEQRFGMDLTEVEFIKDIKRGEGYDVCFWVSDGSIPTLRARKNFLHFQVPFHDVNGKTLLNKMKLFRINKIICNSQFTKEFIDKEYGVESAVVYPPIDIHRIKPKRKENIILSVGRFSRLKQAKRQDILVRAFKRFFDAGFRDWQLILAGGVEVGVGDFLKRLKKSSIGYPIKFLESPSFKEIAELYGRAKIFWSAAGYGVNEKKEPEKVEHFGMAIVEAMAAGAVPFAFDAGGHKEIIKDEENGFLWKDSTKLLEKTRRLIEKPGLTRELSRKAKAKSLVYSQEKFNEEIKKIL